jgi:acetamidase/formamidase
MHKLEATPETVHWGYLSAALKPVLTVSSGDRIEIGTVSGLPEVAANSPYGAPEALLAIHRSHARRTIPGHICTGPIAVSGALPGDVLQVDIETVEPDSDWAYTGIRPLAGALPYDFTERHLSYIRIDREKHVAELPWGMTVPLRPFFGVMCSAPPPEWGELATPPPRQNGGNMDNKELVAGSRLFLPVFVPDALFSVGDGHGAQGDGEICIAAVEMGMRGIFRLSIRRDFRLDWPIAETPTHIITMAFDPDLDDAVVVAIRQMIELLVRLSGISRIEAYKLLSYVGDLRVTQVVNGNKGIHLMVDKSYFRTPLSPAA